MYLEDIPLYVPAKVGSHTFTADDIIAFAREFDPQPFHLSEEGGKASHFGGLCASGWHVAAVWMRLTVAMLDAMSNMDRGTTADAQPDDDRLRGGFSPGFRNMRWRRPVFAGDTVSYTSIVKRKRYSASRKNWGLLSHHNKGENQHGDEVFSFDGSVFAPCRNWNAPDEAR